MFEDDKIRLRQIKGMWAWALIAAWLFYRWTQLEQARQAALSLGCPPSIASSIGDAFFGKGSSCLNSINSDFNSGMFFAVVLAPLAFVVVHYYARWRLGQLQANEEATAIRTAAQSERERKEAHQAVIAEMSKRAQIEQQSSRQASDRFEIITRIGAVDDQLVVLENETTAKNIKLIKLNIGQSIRDIHAKFKEDALAALYDSDEGLRQRVDKTLGEMHRLGLADGRLHSDLAALFDAQIDA